MSADVTDVAGPGTSVHDFDAEESVEIADAIEVLASDHEVQARTLMHDAHEEMGNGTGGVIMAVEALVHSVFALTHQQRADAMRSRVLSTQLTRGV